MIIKPIQPDTVDYEQELALREAVLRKPLGLRLTDADLQQDRSSLHYGLFDSGGVLLACAIASPRSATEAKIRQVAVSSERQGRGLGRQLMTAMEADLAGRGFTRLVLHARSSVSAFYLKLGFTPVGAEFLELSIPHIAMVKTLDLPPSSRAATARHSSQTSRA